MCARAIVYFIETIRWPLLDVQPAHGTKVKVLLNEIIRLCLSGWLITISSISRQIRNDTNTNGLLFDLPNYSAVFSIFPQNNWFVRVCANLHKYSTNKQKFMQMCTTVSSQIHACTRRSCLWSCEQ